MLPKFMLKGLISQLKGFIPGPDKIKEQAINELPKLLNLFTNYLIENIQIPEGYSGIYIGYKEHGGQLYFIPTAHNSNMTATRPLEYTSLSDLINSIPDHKIQEFINEVLEKITSDSKESSFKQPVKIDAQQSEQELKIAANEHLASSEQSDRREGTSSGAEQPESESTNSGVGDSGEEAFTYTGADSGESGDSKAGLQRSSGEPEEQEKPEQSGTDGEGV